MADGNILSGTQQVPVGTDKAYHTDGISDLFHSFAQLLTYIEANVQITEAHITLADNTTNNVSSVKHGFAPKSLNNIATFLSGGAPPTWEFIQEQWLTFTDIVTNDVSITKHGFTPKLPNDATKYLDGTGAYTVPAGSGGSSLPVVDSTEIVKGSVDATKKLRFEVDGFTTGNTRVVTPPDVDITLPGENRANTFTEPQVIKKDDAVTNAITNILDIQHSSSGSVANNFGAGIRFGLESSTTLNRDAAQIAALFTDKTDASRTSALSFLIVNNAGALAETGRVNNLGFLGAGFFTVNAGGFNGTSLKPDAGNSLTVQGSLGFNTSLILKTDGGQFSVDGTTGNFKDKNNTQILTTQQTAVADASGGAVVDTECRAQLNSLLAKLRTHGLIAT